MELVQPIRERIYIEDMKEALQVGEYGKRDCMMWTLGINTGLRVSDLLPLQVKHVKDRTHISITEEKTGKEKRFMINANLKALIDEYIKGMDSEDYLFASKKTKKPMSRVQAYRILNKGAERVNEKHGKVVVDEIGTHTMRKTFGYHHYQKNRDVAILQKLFNHSAPSITLLYIGIQQDEMDKSVEDFSL